MKSEKSPNTGGQVVLPLAGRILLALSRIPGTSDYIEGHQKWTRGSSLSLLARVYPDFLALISDKEILDFGCGEGCQSLALAEAGARYVVGIDTNSESLRSAKTLLRTSTVEQKVEFVETLPAEMTGRFDVVISQNSMEHFRDPVGVLREMSDSLKPEGKLLITFGPPWYAPYGSHMHFFTKVPWVNLLFSENIVMKVRGHFRNDGARKYDQVESGLNKMSVARFENLVLNNSGLHVIYSRYDCVKGLNFLAKIPLVRELFINHLSVILIKKEYYQFGE